jgi:hypothetical protein
VSDVQGVDSVPPHEPRPRRLSGLDALKLHLTLASGLALCAVAFWFELGRAEGGNSLSWAYVFEWPLLGLFGVYMWWNLLHGGTSALRRRKAKPDVAPEFTGMLAAWQEYQRDLHASPQGPTSDGEATEPPPHDN